MLIIKINEEATSTRKSKEPNIFKRKFSKLKWVPVWTLTAKSVNLKNRIIFWDNIRQEIIILINRFNYLVKKGYNKSKTLPVGTSK